MFAKENSYARARSKSVAASRELINLDGQRQWCTDEPSDAEGINLPGPPNAPADYKQVPRYLPQDYSSYCGKPSSQQYELEQKPGFMETACHMLTQMTCSWPRFPKEWESDSGLGEPEDRPVQTGAVMTALVYRAEGKLSREDEIEFLTRWGCEEALAEAKAR